MTLGEGLDPSSITDRRQHSRYLRLGQPGPLTAVSASPSDRLLQDFAFLLTHETPSDAIERTLDTLSETLPLDTLGLCTWPTSATALTLENASLVATRQKTNRSLHRRPPAALLESITQDHGPAILARNVLGDANLAAQNSRGEIDVQSLILAPIRQQKLVGFVHLTTAAGDAPLDTEALEYVVAVCEILTVS